MLIANLANLPFEFAGAVSSLLVARHHALSSRTRRAWLLVGLAMLADATGNVFLYNGTFDPYRSAYSTAGTWAHRTHSGWSTVNSTMYGGIGLWNNYAFATDMTTYGETADQAKGIVRFADRVFRSADRAGRRMSAR